ncbi:MAG TPA: hypothetical protein VEV63_15330 [Streptosporangiaceae bacterium]|nr:hypothetical protein [Streptosporangiaceae bacterium]
MTAADRGPLLHDTDPAPQAAPGGGSGTAGRRPTPRLRTVLGIARVETTLLVRSVLVLAGLLAAGLVIWFLIHSVEPLWWNAAWQIGFGQLVLGMAVLVAAQLAAGRARRDRMADLYASFPATAGTRTLGQLAGLAGAVPASLVLIGAAATAVELLGAIGGPSITLLAGGLMLVIASGAAGIAIGTRFPHPMAGVLGALALFLSSSTTHLASGGGIWLLPWEGVQDDLGSLPSPLAGYPHASAHAVEVAAIAVLAGIAALAVTVRRAQARAWLATAGALAAAVICLAGAVQLQPIPTAGLNRLVADSAKPASTQRCTTANQVKYCLYPGFGSLLPSLEAPVNGVLAHVPARPDHGLTLSQVGITSLDATLTHGHPKQQVSRWDAELQRAPAIAKPASAIYFPIWAWPAFGGQLTDAHFNIALATANWAVHLPLTNIGASQPCVPFDQAREAIALWLAILATHPPSGELQAGLSATRAFHATVVQSTVVPTWIYPGQNAGQVDQFESGPPQNTEAGYRLAHAMTNLPEQKVARVLEAGWARWINWHTTDAQLAAALGIRMPSVYLPPLMRTAPAGSGPGSPVCQ